VQVPVTTRRFSDYILWPDLTETAVQGAIPTESYGNFGLEGGGEMERLAAMDVVEGLGYLWPRLEELTKVLPA
jgi:hypothetical protein